MKTLKDPDIHEQIARRCLAFHFKISDSLINYRDRPDLETIINGNSIGIEVTAAIDSDESHIASIINREKDAESKGKNIDKIVNKSLNYDKKNNSGIHGFSRLLHDGKKFGHSLWVENPVKLVKSSIKKKSQKIDSYTSFDQQWLYVRCVNQILEVHDISEIREYIENTAVPYNVVCVEHSTSLLLFYIDGSRFEDLKFPESFRVENASLSKKWHHDKAARKNMNL
ncbi:hypothetical protein [Erysipelothrix anatis]|uniref:hypothetical protein n=1 Tax=Erysipelothrix anatis TaxID=2683713 RepID=UPI001356C432|nr:hypothetical protein [Erysipelothrix anatis]